MSSLSAVSLVDQPLLFADRYQTERLLGQGGMGAVYAVFDPVTQRRIALKLLSKQVNAKAIGLFEREYQTLASLKHPRIVEVFEYGRCAEGAYYTMELLEGNDLSAAAPMPWREVCACLRDVASILGVLHVRGLVHRDLSPRNLWRTLDGRLKLIDFGALAPFGTASDIMGTPPFVPPEALRGQPLDARSDLYALGALGYWLTTSVQAYPAKSLGELATLWTREPVSPGNLVTLLDGGQQEPIPTALDTLLLALLRLDPGQRPSSTAELIDRLSAIAELPPEGHEGAAQGYLQSNAFVGRLRERERLLHHLEEAQRGTPQALLIEGAAGLGRTRLLAELAIAARVAGATTLSLDARQGPRPYALAAALIEPLIVISPAARKVAEAHVELLGPLSASLRATLGTSSRAPLRTQSEERLRTQAALQETVLAACKEQLVALFVDDLHALDEESQALLAVLARAGKGHQLLLVASVLREGSSELSSLAQSLRNVSALFRLLPLTNGETLALLRSVFGNAPYLERLAERLQRLSDGNPSYCLELSQHLVRVGAAHYSDGMWVLPTDLASAQLPRSRAEGFVARLTQLTPAARKLAAQVSVPHHGPLPMEVCLTISPDAPTLLVELREAGVLQESSAGYGFTHDVLKETLAKELSAAERIEAHLRFAQVLVQRSADRSDRLSAGLHLMQAGEVARGEQLQRDCAREVLDGGDLDMLRRDAPLLRQGLELLDRHGRDDHALAPLLTALACSGYYAERSYAVRYGDRCVAALERILALPLARKLRRFLGARLSLFVALFVAGLGIAKRRSYALNLKDSVRYFFSATASLAGTAAVCIDSKTSHRFADALLPLTALGKDHAASHIYEFTRYLGHRSEDRLEQTMQMGRALVQRFSGKPIRNLPDGIRENFRIGALFSLGVTLSWRDTPECLQIADELDKSTPFYRMAADQLRSNFHGTQGNAAEAARYRQRVETHAIQLGSAWQVETWAPADMLKTALITQDALGIKRAAQELSRLAEEIPSFGQHARTARAAYLVLRNKPAEAAALLAGDEEPLAVVGWARVRGLLARSHNDLGQHARAREICTDALSRMDPADLAFPAMNINVQVELVLAEAGLGDFASARAKLDQLLHVHEPNRGPLTMAALHDAYVQVALREQDFAGCSEQLAKLDQWARPTGIPSLLERSDLLRRELTRAQRAGDTPEGEVRLLSDDVHLITRVQLILTQTGSLVAERASKGLQIAIELSGADDGFIVLQGGQAEATAYLNEAPNAELASWAHRRLMAAYASDETAAVEHVDSLIDLNLNVVDGVRYCVAPLWARRDNQDVVVAALALGFRKGAPRLPGADVLRVIAGHLADLPA